MYKLILSAACFCFSWMSWSQCEDFMIDLIPNNPTCNNFSDGSIGIIIDGGTEPYDVDATDTFGNPLDYFPGGAINTLFGGWYYITITDDSGCTFVDSIELINPDPIVVEYTITPPSAPGLCDGLGVIDTITGYQGDYEDISVFWSPGGDGTFIYEDMCAGNYMIVVNDAFGCSSIEEYSTGSLADVSHKDNLAVNIIYQSGFPCVSMSGANEVIEFQCFDLKGSFLFSLALGNGITVLEIPSNGLYFYRYLDSNQQILGAGKLIF